MAKSQGIDTIGNYRALVESLKSGNPRPVYWLTGPETWFTDRVISIVKALVPEGLDDFNLDVFSGREVPLSRMLDACKTFPMMSDRRVVIVREFMAMFDRRKQVSGDADEDSGSSSQDELLHYLENVNTSTVLVLSDVAAVAGNTKLGKALRNPKLCHMAEFDRLQGMDLIKWIRQMFREQHKKQIDDVSAQLLVDISGDELLTLSHEITKLAQFAGPAEVVTQDLVRTMATEHKEAAVFDVKDALYAGNLDVLLDKANTVVDAADTPVGGVLGLLGYLSSHYLQCWQISRMHEKGLPKPDMLAAMNKSSYIFDRLYKDARAVPGARYPDIFEALLDADTSIKGMGYNDPFSVVSMTMIKLHRLHHLH